MEENNVKLSTAKECMHHAFSEAKGYIQGMHQGSNQIDFNSAKEIHELLEELEEKIDKLF